MVVRAELADVVQRDPGVFDEHARCSREFLYGESRCPLQAGILVRRASSGILVRREPLRLGYAFSQPGSAANLRQSRAATYMTFQEKLFEFKLVEQ